MNIYILYSANAYANGMIFLLTKHALCMFLILSAYTTEKVKDILDTMTHYLQTVILECTCNFLMCLGKKAPLNEKVNYP